MCNTEIGSAISEILVQFEKALSAMLVTLFGIIMVSNVYLETTMAEVIVFEPSEIISLLKVQPVKALLLTLVKPSPTITLISFVQLAKAELEISVT